MVNILLAFVTGLTTGGLSCLAVQGGLLASSLAGQIEQEFQNAPVKVTRRKGRRDKRVQNSSANRGQLTEPILAFLAAKLIAYTLLGFLLGLAGQVFQLSAFTRAIFQVAIGIFMVGSALRMLNVHPVFRYFVIEPPAFLRRKLRHTAADNKAGLWTPAFLGFLTVLIPCGVTQVMMAAALATANPLTGAALLFAYTLGTSPLFFAVAYFATQLGARVEKYFMRAAAILILMLGLYTVDSGITLAGSPVSITRLVNSVTVQAGSPGTSSAGFELIPYQPADADPQTGGEQVQYGDNVVTINVLNTRYEPSVVRAKAGVPIQLRLVSKDVYSCSLAFVIPSLRVERYLEPTGEEWIDIPAQARGTRIPFSCSMGMFTGVIVFDL